MTNLQNNGMLMDQVWQAALAGLLHVAALPEVAHHAPASGKHLSELVALADKLSVGERADLDQDARQKSPPQLISIFDRLALDPQRQPRAENYLPLLPLRLDEQTLFPGTAQGSDARGNASKELRKQLEDAAREDIADPQMYLENLLAAMQKTTWCVPSAYYSSIPDVSLYDHARMTAALAVCLANWEERAVHELHGAVERNFQGKQPQSDDNVLLNQPVALLIGGDISGVQDFIYTLTSKNAAKTLRGRSFYLQLLGEAVLRYVLRELGLPYTNVIYSGGGNFFLLAPVSAQEHLPAIQRRITQMLLTHHGTALYLALGETAVPARGFKRGEFKTHWDVMHKAIGAAKQRRYTELGDELYAHVFEPLTHGGNQEKTCAVCGDESEKAVLLGEEETSKDKICPLCKSFQKLGTQLTRADFVALGLSTPQATEKQDAASALRAFGMQFEFDPPHSQTIAFEDKPERAVVWALDDAEKFPAVRDVPTARLTRYTVNRVPTVRDQQEADEINAKLKSDEQDEDYARPRQPKTFTHLEVQAQGIDRLGVLRMDVDNLGDLFSRGFGEGEKNLATLSRIAALSFQMGLFFEGWVKQLCAEKADLVYAVYAGGDDVFLIAPWSIVPGLAQKIVADLYAYTGKNPDVHLSAGMTFIHGKYPVYQAADDAKDALDQAKAVDGKNAFSFLGRAWKWNEFESVNAKFERLKKLVSDPKKDGLGAPQAILQTLRQFALDEADKAKQHKGKPVWGKWMWLGAYKLTRDAARTRNPDVAKELLAIRDELSANEYSEIGQWGTAARWAQLWLREQ